MRFIALLLAILWGESASAQVPPRAPTRIAILDLGIPDTPPYDVVQPLLGVDLTPAELAAALPEFLAESRTSS